MTHWQVLVEFKAEAVVHAASDGVVKEGEGAGGGTPATQAVADTCSGTHLFNATSTRTGSLMPPPIALSLHMLLMSSDAVFDGSSPPYAPSHACNPLTPHGRTKVVAETCVRSCTGLSYVPQALPAVFFCNNLNRYVILRVPVMWGRVLSLEESPVTSVIPR